MTKKCAPKLVFFNEKQIEKDSDDFESQIFGTFGQLAINPKLKIQ